MTSAYAPTPTILAATVPMVDDGDARNAASVRQSLEPLANGIAFAGSLKVDTINTSGTWTCPAGVTRVYVEGCGGGGGGGSGNNGTAGAGDDLNQTDRWFTSGSGGGGSILSGRSVTVVPTTVYPTTIGAGGAAAADGSDTTFGSLAVFAGAGKGYSGSSAGASTTYDQEIGGMPARLSSFGTTRVFGSTGAYAPSYMSPASGGASADAHFATPNFGSGARNPVGGFAGGAGGSRGNDAGTRRAGGAAGGGGAGPFGAGGAGGNGGNGNAAGAGTNGTAGTAAAANTGAGGGGGGGGGHGTITGATNGAGGAGGGGKMFISYNGAQAVIT